MKLCKNLNTKYLYYEMKVEAENFYENAARVGRAGGSVAEEAYGRASEIKARLAAMPKVSATAPATTNAIPVLKK